MIFFILRGASLYEAAKYNTINAGKNRKRNRTLLNTILTPLHDCRPLPAIMRGPAFFLLCQCGTDRLQRQLVLILTVFDDRFFALVQGRCRVSTKLHKTYIIADHFNA